MKPSMPAPPPSSAGSSDFPPDSPIAANMNTADELSDVLVLDEEELHRRYLCSDLRKVELVRR